MPRSTLMQALVYAVAALVAARLIVGQGECYDTLGCTDPCPLAVAAAAAAVSGFLMLMRFGWLARLRHPVARGIARGIAVVLLSHLLIGPFAMLLGLLSTGRLYYDAQMVASLLATFTYVVLVGHITLPLGALAGAINEFIAHTIDRHTPRSNA